jgi:hypothetical protein
MEDHPDTDIIRAALANGPDGREDEWVGQLCDEVDALRSALFIYGGHFDDCLGDLSPLRCTCGWSDVQKDGP